MKQYHKIQSIYKRNPKNNHKTFIEGDFSLPEFEYLKDCMWTGTEKVDGMNIRIIFNGNSIAFGGKSDDAQIPSKLIARLNQRFGSQHNRFTELFPEGACLYGEGYGAGIQKGGGNYRPDQDFVLFDVRIGEWWLQRTDVKDVAEKLNLDIVPELGAKPLVEWVDIARQGFTSQWGNFVAEGVILRPTTELQTRRGDRIITKIKYKDFPH